MPQGVRWMKKLYFSLGSVDNPYENHFSNTSYDSILS